LIYRGKDQAEGMVIEDGVKAASILQEKRRKTALALTFTPHTKFKFGSHFGIGYYRSSASNPLV
jgi:hypothetical protein